MASVSPDKVARALNLTVSRVHQLVKEGMPKEGRGQYDPVKCMLWYIRYLQAAIEKRYRGFVGEGEDRVRLLRANADLREMELAEERGRLVAIEEVNAEMASLVITTKAIILAVPPRIAPELLGLTSRVMAHAIVEKALNEALHKLSNSRSAR